MGIRDAVPGYIHEFSLQQDTISPGDERGGRNTGLSLLKKATLRFNGLGENLSRDRNMSPPPVSSSPVSEKAELSNHALLPPSEPPRLQRTFPGYAEAKRCLPATTNTLGIIMTLGILTHKQGASSCLIVLLWYWASLRSGTQR